MTTFSILVLAAAVIAHAYILKGSNMSALADQITALAASVTNLKTVKESVVAFANGVPALIAAAVKKAQEAGATPEQLQSITDAASAIKSSADEMAAAVVANTPAATATDTPAENQS